MLFSLCLLCPLWLCAQLSPIQLQNPVRFLALGDSYTIGQSVAATDRWPVQLQDSLQLRGFQVDTLRIIATTGWRTDNLLSAITNQGLSQQHYNLVSLLIGVNNQYQGKPISQYIAEFPQLLDSAIAYAGGDTAHVFVVSIPDYAYTPYGQSTGNAAQISMEIDQYNAINKHIADSLGVTYFDITPVSRQGLNQPSLVAGDGLHPSGAQYTQWIQLMLQHIAAGIATGMQSPGKTLDIEIYPNPAREEITIYKDKTIPGSSIMELYNGQGLLVLQCAVSTGFSVCSLNSLSPGLYTVRISSARGQFIKRLVKQ